MKKTIFFSLILLSLSISCNDERDSLTNDDEELLSQTLSLKCLTAEPSFVSNFGNPSTYPQIDVSSFYSLTAPTNGQLWFFNVIQNPMVGYLVNKYHTNIIWNVGNRNVTFPPEIRQPKEYGNYIQGYGLYPNSIVSPYDATQVVYQILSNIDYIIQYNLQGYKPIAIGFDYEKTMCGDYAGLYYKVYFSK